MATASQPTMGASGETTTLLGSVVGDAQQAPFPWKLVLLCAALAWCAVRALEWAWWRPRRLARVLRSQGLRGTAYRSLAGDAPLTEQLNREARSRPLPLGCHDVAPRAMPLFHQTMKEHGTALHVAFLFLQATLSLGTHTRTKSALLGLVSKIARSTGPVSTRHAAANWLF